MPRAKQSSRSSLHDVRRSVASGLARLGTPLEVTEKILNHTSGSFAGIVGVYQRVTNMPTKCATALNAWAAHVESLVTSRTPSNEAEPNNAELVVVE